MGSHRSPRVIRAHAAVVAAAHDPDTFSSAVSRHLQVPNGLDGEEHRRFRAVIDPFFSPARMQALEPVVRAVAADLVTSLPRDAELDVVGGLGAAYAVRVTCRWLGWPADLEPVLLDWMDANRAATRSGEFARMAEVAEQYDEIVRRQSYPRREAGVLAPDDVTTELTRVHVGSPAAEGGRLLSDEEMVSILRNWTAGDLSSVALCVGVIIRFVADHPDVQQRARELLDAHHLDQDVRNRVLDQFVDEILRIDDPFVSNRRVTTREVCHHGEDLAEGTLVLLHWTDANRDTEVFGDPDAFDPVVNAAHNLVWGTGPHVCPGRPLATMELRVLLEELLRATTEIAPGGPTERQQPPLGGHAVAPVVLH